MFLSFFYLLRARGLAVSLNEWMVLMEALSCGLADSSLTGFYYLCRTVLVKSETDYDKFDLAFAEYFQSIEPHEVIPDEIWEWLKDGELERSREELEGRLGQSAGSFSLEELQRMLEERLKEQDEAHHGGSYWVGTGGTSTMGHGGYNKQGLRIGGEGRYRSALQVANQRDFRDFRDDSVLDTRQFQMALRRLRQYSQRGMGAKTELDVEETVRATGDNGGLLSLRFQRPRKNSMKLLLLFDSGGSMRPYGQLVSSLFQAVDQSSHFRDLKVYYFHNCVYDQLYLGPDCRWGDWLDTKWVLQNLDSEYRVIFVGDGEMAPSELLSQGGNWRIGSYNETPGITWLERLCNRYPRNIWLNPVPEKYWDLTYGKYTLNQIRRLVPMYELTLNGLVEGIRKLT